MVFIRLLIVFALTGIFLQDLKSRAVFWLWFPLLICLFVADQLMQHVSVATIIESWLADMLFLSVQFSMLTLYFCWKERRWVNITRDLLGWGDILLLGTVGFYLCFEVFVAFYLISLMLIVAGWIIWRALADKRSNHIPLAGLQAFLLVLLLGLNWLLFGSALSNGHLQLMLSKL